MSDKKSKDRLAIGIAIVSLVISIAAVALPYMEQRREFRVLQGEELSVRLNPHADGQFHITEFNFGPRGRVMQVPWELTLSNIGNQKLSITTYSVSSGISPNSTSYSGIDGGMFDLEQKPIYLPLTLEPGESRRFVLFVGILVPPKVHEALSVGHLKLRTVGDATKILAKQGLDLYGNKVNYQEYAGGAYVISVEKTNQIFPTFWYQAVSGRGNICLASASTYERP